VLSDTAFSSRYNSLIYFFFRLLYLFLASQYKVLLLGYQFLNKEIHCFYTLLQNKKVGEESSVSPPTRKFNNFYIFFTIIIKYFCQACVKILNIRSHYHCFLNLCGSFLPFCRHWLNGSINVLMMHTIAVRSIAAAVTKIHHSIVFKI
jgi:hypothetical protein